MYSNLIKFYTLLLNNNFSVIIFFKTYTNLVLLYIL